MDQDTNLVLFGLMDGGSHGLGVLKCPPGTTPSTLGTTTRVLGVVPRVLGVVPRVLGGGPQGARGGPQGGGYVNPVVPENR